MTDTKPVREGLLHLKNEELYWHTYASVAYCVIETRSKIAEITFSGYIMII